MTTTTTTPPPSVGDFFYSSGGYDQTNVHFYKVVGVTPSGKSVKVQKWSKTVVSDHGSSVTVVPGEGPSSDWKGEAPVKTKKVQTSNWNSDENYIKVSSYEYGYPFDGEPKSQTGVGWGH